MKKLSDFIQESKSSNSVMEDYFDIQSNNHAPQQITEGNINKIFTTHKEHGFIIISANRSDESPKYNKEKTRELIKDIQDFGYSYFPVYGGYKGSDGVTDNYEPSFFVTCFKKKKDGLGNFEDLEKFAVKMCGKYNQDSVLVVKPNDKAAYVNREGEVVGKQTDKATTFNDIAQEFFTATKKVKPSKLFKGKIDGNDRFTYDLNFECYTNPSPCTLNERVRRTTLGEIIFLKRGS